MAFRSALRRLQHQPGDARLIRPRLRTPARLSIRFVSLARTAPAARTRWARRQPSAALQRTHHHHELQANFIAARFILADADLIAESTCLVSYEVRRAQSVLAIKACNESSKPQDIPSDHKTRQGASANDRYDTSNVGVPLDERAANTYRIQSVSASRG